MRLGRGHVASAAALAIAACATGGQARQTTSPAAQQASQAQAASEGALGRAKADQAAQQATQVGQQSERQATNALGQEGRQVARGEQTLTGRIEQIQPGQIAVRPSGGPTMTFLAGAQTTIRVDGQEAAFSELGEGENARVAYQLAGQTPTALTIDVIRNPGAAGAGAQQGGTSGSAGQRGPEQRPPTGQRSGP